MPLRDAGMLLNAGFRIGFHGHTHRHSARTYEQLFGRAFIVVSAGSIGAGPTDRPDAAANQFNIVTLSTSFVRVESFERSGETGIYKPQDPHFVLLSERPGAPTAHCSRHQRHYQVARNGIARARIQLDHLSGRGKVTLGVITPPYCRSRPLPQPGGPPTTEERLLDGRVKYVLDASDREAVDWQYEVSNGYPIDQFDHRTRPHMSYRGEPVSDTWFPDLGRIGLDGHFSRPHEVRIPSDRLDLRLTIPKDFCESDEAVLVQEERRDDDSVPSWRALAEKITIRATVVPYPDGDYHDWSCAVNGPVLGRRYGIAYQPRHGRKVPDRAVLELTHGILRALGEGERQAALNGHLADAMKGLADDLSRQGPDEVDLAGASDRLTWHAMLWDHRTRYLETAFGHMPFQHWGMRFPSGDGVAGHAFRFGQVAAWHRESAGDDLLYQRLPEGVTREFSTLWILSIPILESPGCAASLGVLSIQASGDDDKVAPLLALVARRVPSAPELPGGTSLPPPEWRHSASRWADDDLAMLLRWLVATVNRRFWSALATELPVGEFRLTSVERSLASRILRAWSSPDGKPPQPATGPG